MLIGHPKIFKAGQAQQGLALVVILFLIGLIAVSFVINSLTVGSYQVQRSLDTNQALLQAKNAVIGYVITGLSGSSSNPGQFPCPEDTSMIGTASEGQAKGNCGYGLTVGRFAWRTLGTGELKDGNTDKLWYALASGFRGNSPINSDSQGLTIDEVPNQALAIVFSPGVALAGQNRSAVAVPDVINYLDLENNNNNEKYITHSTSDKFNDQLMVIKPDEIFPILEKRVLKDIKSYLLAYKTKWQAYPYPATFSNPQSSSFIGNPNELGGFLPIGDPNAAWLSSTITNSSAGGGLGDILGGILGGGLNPAASVPCTSVPSTSTTPSKLKCTVSPVSQNDEIIIEANISNLAKGFFKPLDQATINAPDNVDAGTFNIHTNNLKDPSLTQVLNSQGNGVITLKGKANIAGSITVELPLPQLDKWLNSNSLSYLIENNWHHLVYYKVAQQFLPGGNNQCNPTPNCLTVNSVINGAPQPIPNIHALLMAAGSRLDSTEAKPAPTYTAVNPAQKRPGDSLADYFDSINNSSGSLTFDSKQLPLITFNDQIEIVE